MFFFFVSDVLDTVLYFSHPFRRPAKGELSHFLGPAFWALGDVDSRFERILRI